jgi:3',5'-cyclic AMP phosphodiesterase CpdA
VAGRILHVSDLHTGTREDPEVEAALRALLGRVDAELIVASGDLTHRGQRKQHERAHRFLTSFGLPVLTVPGNHDMPYSFPARFTRTYDEFTRLWGDVEQTYSSPALHVIGLNSSRRLRQQGGALRREQLEGAVRRLQAAQAGAYRVVVLHHHMVGAPWRASRKRPVSHRNRVLEALVDAGADLVLAGHIHQAALSERHEFEVIEGDVRACIVSIAPGLGQPRPRRRGEARGLHVYEPGETTVAADTYIWRGGDWGLTARRLFPRGLGPLAVTEPERPARP